MNVPQVTLLTVNECSHCACVFAKADRSVRRASHDRACVSGDGRNLDYDYLPAGGMPPLAGHLGVFGGHPALHKCSIGSVTLFTMRATSTKEIMRKANGFSWGGDCGFDLCILSYGGSISS